MPKPPFALLGAEPTDDELEGFVAALRGEEARHLPGHHFQGDHAGKRGGVGAGTAAAMAVEDEIRTIRGGEVAVAFDAAGREVFRKAQMGKVNGGLSDRAYGVDFTDAEVARLGGTVMTHNHPTGLEFDASSPEHRGSSFSGDDIQLAVDANVAEMRVVSPGYRYSLRPGPDGWGTANDVRFQWMTQDLYVRQEFTARIAAGTLSIPQANAEHYHEVTTRLARERGWTYERIADPMEAAA